MSISEDRKDRFTSQPEDFIIIKPAPKKKKGKETKADTTKNDGDKTE